MDENQISILRELKDSILNTIYIEKIEDFSLCVVLDTNGEKIVFRNNPTIQCDGDDYPFLKIEHYHGELKNLKDIKIEGHIKSVSIIRDRVVWEYDENIWTVDIDIAVRIVVDKTNLMITAYDSLGGLLELIYLKDHLTGITHKTEELKKYWMMKTDRFQSLKRSEIFI